MQKKKVLFVEDDPDTRDIVAAILEDEDIELLKAAEVPALAAIADAEPDLILLDEWLPGKTAAPCAWNSKVKNVPPISP